MQLFFGIFVSDGLSERRTFARQIGILDNLAANAVTNHKGTSNHSMSCTNAEDLGQNVVKRTQEYVSIPASSALLRGIIR